MEFLEDIGLIDKRGNGRSPVCNNFMIGKSSFYQGIYDHAVLGHFVYKMNAQSFINFNGFSYLELVEKGIFKKQWDQTCCQQNIERFIIH